MGQVDTLQVVADVVFIALIGCTLANAYSVVSVRAGSRTTRLDVRAAAWCALAALAGILDVTVQQASKHITDTATPSLNDHLAGEPETHA